jgi:hypothetical protein
MPFEDFVERGLARIKAKLGSAGNRASPSFDDLHAAVGEALQHVADEAGAPAAAAAPSLAAPARELDEVVWSKIEYLVDQRVAAAIAALPAAGVPETVGATGATGATGSA